MPLLDDETGVSCEYGNLRHYVGGDNINTEAAVLCKKLSLPYIMSELSICVRHVLGPSWCEALQELLRLFEFSFFFLGRMKLHRYFYCRADMLFLLYIIGIDRISAY